MHAAAESVWQALAPRLAGFTVEVAADVDSTNAELMRRARAGRTEPVLLVAERQSEGRGRLGRSWQASPGDSLTFSLGLALTPTDWSGLSLAVGVALAEALHPRIELKWPNDLWLEGRKLGGILVETASTGATASAGARHAVIGVGLNLSAPPAQGLSTPPAGLREFWPGATAGEVLERVAEPLVTSVQAFEAGGFAAFQARFEVRNLLRGRTVNLSDGTSGTAVCVDSQGALIVHTAAGMTSVTSNEVSVRPA